MTDEAKVLIQYIGKQPKKADSVNPGSDRVWPYPGAAIEVPAHEKWAYLAHPNVWREISAAEYRNHVDAKVERDAAESEWMTFISRKLPLLPMEILKRASVALEREIAKRAAAEPTKPAKPSPSTKTATTVEDVMAPDADPAMVRAFMARVERIANVIKNDMDLREDTQAVNGWPKAEVIQNHTGSLPSQDEIAEAMRLLGYDLQRMGRAA